MIDFGYCTNVHAANSSGGVQQALKNVAVPIQVALFGERPMPIGLWISENFLHEFRNQLTAEDFGRWLNENRLIPSTLNGFPQRDFHQPVVKHQVYRPTWAENSRLVYTQELATLQANWLAAGTRRGTISTVPLGWTGQIDSMVFLENCQANLLKYARHAAGLEQQLGVHIRLCLEAEPGCYLGSNEDLGDFFEEFLSDAAADDEALIRRYLGVCHDICHAAVMFEDQLGSFRRFANLGIEIAKVQVSSALVANFDAEQPDDVRATKAHLARFVEPRYLHQTMINGEYFVEDLALELPSGLFDGEWRVHFHVPIFALELGPGLSTTQSEIETCLRGLWPVRQSIDWEIETYAWTVLPDSVQSESLGGGIRKEFDWLKQLFSRLESEWPTPDPLPQDR